MKYKEIRKYELKKFKDLLLLKFHWNYEVKPGQFFMIGSDDAPCLLNRPFSISDFIDNEAIFRIKIKGKFTKFLGNLNSNKILRIIGPCGIGVDVKKWIEKYDTIVLIGGGIGVAPLIFLYKEFKKYMNSIYLIYGAPSKNELHYAFYGNNFKDLIIYTEDGSKGSKGYPTDHLKYFRNSKNLSIIACGPKEMYKSLIRYNQFDTFVFLEENMGCGFGVCLSCVVKTIHGYKRICKEGPLFNLKHIIL